MLAFTAPAPFPFALGIAIVVSVSAWKVGSLSASGAVAAAMVGAIALGAGWGNGALLVCWFVLAALLSRFGGNKKAERVRAIVAKVDARDASQVLANGFVFSVASFGIVLLDRAPGFVTHANASFVQYWQLLCSVAAAGSLAAAGADTWATEIGTLYGRAPWSLRLRMRVPAGTSGAITAIGTLAMLVGASVIAWIAVLIAVPHATKSAAVLFVAIAVGGASGAFADTFAGAWMQERRWCPRCALETEQRVHTCGTTTVIAGGSSVLNNDVVNVVCTVVGALVAAAITVA